MRATSLLLVLATAGLAAACGGKPAPEQPAPEPVAAPTPTPAPPAAAAADLDRDALVTLLRTHAGNVTHVARALGTSRSQVRRLAARLGVALDGFR